MIVAFCQFLAHLGLQPVHKTGERPTRYAFGIDRFRVQAVVRAVVEGLLRWQQQDPGMPQHPLKADYSHLPSPYAEQSL